MNLKQKIFLIATKVEQDMPQLASAVKKATGQQLDMDRGYFSSLINVLNSSSEEQLNKMYDWLTATTFGPSEEDESDFFNTNQLNSQEMQMLAENKLDKTITLLEKITGKKVMLEEEHECHCGGSCCTDKGPLKESVNHQTYYCFSIDKDYNIVNTNTAPNDLAADAYQMYANNYNQTPKPECLYALCTTSSNWKQIAQDAIKELKAGKEPKDIDLWEASNETLDEDAKDTQRVQDIKTKANGSGWKAFELAQQMANAITTPDKAYNRYKAAMLVFGPGQVADAFLDRAKKLGHADGIAAADTRDAEQKAKWEAERKAAIEKVMPSATNFMKVIGKRYPELEPSITTSSPIQYQHGDGKTVYVVMTSTPRLRKGLSGLGDHGVVSRQHEAIRKVADKFNGRYDFNYGKPYVAFRAVGVREGLDESVLNEVGNLSVTLNTLIADSQQNWKLRANLIERTINILEANKDLYNWFVDNRGEFLRKLYHHPNDITTYRIANEMTKAIKGMGLSEVMQPVESLNENSQVTDLAWEALSALEIVRQKIARAIEIEPSDNLGDASRYVDAAYRSLKPLEVSEATLKEDYRDEKENIQILKNIAKLAKANPKSRKLQNMNKEALEIYKSFKAGRFNNSLENSLDEEVEMLLDNYSPIPKGIVPYETLGGLRD